MGFCAFGARPRLRVKQCGAWEGSSAVAEGDAGDVGRVLPPDFAVFASSELDGQGSLGRLDAGFGR